MYKLVVTLFLTCSALAGFAKEYKIEMLNKSNGQTMVFKPMFLKANIGDVVTFVPTTKGHISQSVYTPKDANTWKGITSKEVKVTLNKEGIYIYKCQNHGIMGMAGVIQIGKPTNLKEVKKFYSGFKKKLIMNKVRLDKIINDLKNTSN